MKLLAHSAKGDVPEQEYREHVLRVRKQAVDSMSAALEYYTGSPDLHAALASAVDNAAVFHDLGKVDLRNQEVLDQPDSREKLPLNHVDAGTAFLKREKAFGAALLAYWHHTGLSNVADEFKKSGGNLAFRDVSICEEIDGALEGYIADHMANIGQPADVQTVPILKGLPLRLALSCLVNGDHHDTARHYGEEPDLDVIPVRWAERQTALNKYVGGLKEGKADERNILRNEIYEACLNSDIDPAIKCCDAPVGSGKTTAVMAHLLKVAAEKKLRHIFVVLPYTNIIKQSVEVYRKALVLPGENPEEVVAAHYHQAEFSSLGSRHLTTLWQAPVIVTSAVQFFETLSASGTSRLRKLNELPGSAVFVDESHSAMPMHIWPQQWRWMNELARCWSTHFVLASGSLVRFWEFPGFDDGNSNIPNLLPLNLQGAANGFESARISYPTRPPKPMDREELLRFILSKTGPRLVILNTVQSAAVIAHELKMFGQETLHLSTALAPLDRETIIARIHRRLEFSNSADWTLVATSCVEAGVDFSFKTAFRESSTVTSLIQTGGRANRHGKDNGCEIVDFRTHDSLLNKHPAFDESRKVVDQMFDEGLMNQMPPMELATEAVRRELLLSAVKESAVKIEKSETDQDYKSVSRLCRIIDADTRLVVVSPATLQRLVHREKVSFAELLQNSVQLWSNKIESLDLIPVKNHEDIYSLGSYAYEPDFLGYMEGLLPLIYQHEDGLII